MSNKKNFPKWIHLQTRDYNPPQLQNTRRRWMLAGLLRDIHDAWHLGDFQRAEKSSQVLLKEFPDSHQLLERIKGTHNKMGNHEYE